MKKILKIGLICLCSFAVAPVCIVSAAENGSDVYEDTRYSATGFEYVDKIIETFEGLATGFVPDVVSDVKGGFSKFGSKVADTITENAVESANRNWGSSGSYTIQQAFVIMGKRKINYPNGDYEVQTVYLYRDKNVSTATPQQFGTYTIAPNTLFLVRDTSFDGVIACSFPLGEGNNFQLETYNGDSACDILFYSPDNDTIVYDTSGGRETYGFRHGAVWRPPELHFINNSVNSIVNNNLIDTYDNNGSSYYNNYLPNYYLDNFEALVGTGYWYEGSQGFMNGVQPFYCTTAFFNSPDEFGSSHINNFWTTDPDNIDPSKPPAYILPNDNPLSGGQTINNNTINNYADYGITDLNGQLSIDPDILVGALGGLIDPDFTGALGGVFGAQPELGLGFDTPLDLNLPELFDDFIDSITVYPPVTGWDPPKYPAVNTSAYIPATYPTYPTATYPSNYVENMGDTLNDGWDLFDDLGLLGFLIPIILLCVAWRFTGG